MDQIGFGEGEGIPSLRLDLKGPVAILDVPVAFEPGLAGSSADIAGARGVVRSGEGDAEVANAVGAEISRIHHAVAFALEFVDAGHVVDPRRMAGAEHSRGHGDQQHAHHGGAGGGHDDQSERSLLAVCRVLH